MSEELVTLICDDASERMERAVAHTRSDLASIRTGRASPALVEKLPVDYYGSIVPLQQLASFSVPDARMLVVTPFDKGSMGAVERAIQESNLGLNPSNDGVNIRLAFPQLTEERRKEFVRLARQKAEDGKNCCAAPGETPARRSNRLRRPATSPRTSCTAPSSASTRWRRRSRSRWTRRSTPRPPI